MSLLILMVVRVTARVGDVKITDADGLPVKNNSILRLNSSVICSTPYDLNFTFSWTNVTNVYNSSQVVAGNTLILSEVGYFTYRCNVHNFPALKRLGFVDVCNTSRTFRAIVSSFGII